MCSSFTCVGRWRFDPKSHRVHYSVVTRAELFAGNTATDLISVLLAPFREIEVGRVVAERAGRLRREAGVRLPDALIAATAIEHKLSRTRATDQTSRRLPGCGFETLADSPGGKPLGET
jgi:predicted nucleic acid-binding protein